jgi:hypothetical protein
MERFNHEMGWPDGTSADEAVAGTLQNARDHCESYGWVMEETDPAPEINMIRTPAHEEAGEFLISIWASRYRPAEEV